MTNRSRPSPMRPSVTCRRVPPSSSSRPACQLDVDSEEQGSPAQGRIDKRLCRGDAAGQAETGQIPRTPIGTCHANVVSHPQRGRLREDYDQPTAPQARDPPVIETIARAVRTLGAGFGIEALAEVVTATAAGDKAKVAIWQAPALRSPPARPTVRRLAPGKPRAQEDARLPREDHSRAARARARAAQAPGSSAFGKTREPPSSAGVT